MSINDEKDEVARLKAEIGRLIVREAELLAEKRRLVIREAELLAACNLELEKRRAVEAEARRRQQFWREPKPAASWASGEVTVYALTCGHVALVHAVGFPAPDLVYCARCESSEPNPAEPAAADVCQWCLQEPVDRIVILRDARGKELDRVRIGKNCTPDVRLAADWGMICDEQSHQRPDAVSA